MNTGRYTNRLIAVAGLSISMLGLFPTIAAGMQEASQQEVHFMSGGVGDEELEIINQRRNAFSLVLLFAQKPEQGRSAYIVDVAVTIRNSKQQTVLQTTSDGPYLMIDLPAGSYTIEATYGNLMKHQTLTLTSGKPQRMVMTW